MFAAVRRSQCINPLLRAAYPCLASQTVKLAEGGKCIIGAKGLIGNGVKQPAVNRLANPRVVIAQNVCLFVLHGAHHGRRVGRSKRCAAQLFFRRVVPLVQLRFQMAEAKITQAAVNKICNLFDLSHRVVAVPGEKVYG